MVSVFKIEALKDKRVQDKRGQKAGTKVILELNRSVHKRCTLEKK